MSIIYFARRFRCIVSGLLLDFCWLLSGLFLVVWLSVIYHTSLLKKKLLTLTLQYTRFSSFKLKLKCSSITAYPRVSLFSPRFSIFDIRHYRKRPNIISHLNRVILGLGTYLFPVNALSKKKRMMRHGMSKPHKLKVRYYTARLIDLND